MKKLIFLSVFSTVLLFAGRPAQAQFKISVNIGNQPAWAPVGYDEAQYYYIPDMDMYYDVPAHQFVYQRNRRWVRTAVLPDNYRRYDLYKVHKVAINERDAYRNYDRDRQRYSQYKGKYDQQPIRESHDEKYSHNKSNWDNNRFKETKRGKEYPERDKGRRHD